MCAKYLANGDVIWVVGQKDKLSRKMDGVGEYEYLKEISEDTLFNTYKSALLNNTVAEPFTDFN